MSFSPIVPDATTPDEDRDEMERDHFQRYGHYPIPDLTGHRRCIVPECVRRHDATRRMIESPGVHIEIPFDHHEVISEDAQPIVAYKRAYQRLVDKYKDRIDEIDERIAFREQKERG